MELTITNLWEILVPVTNNNGHRFPLKHHKDWDNFVKEITHGLTILKTAKGIWVNDTGIEYKEKMIPVRISCNKNQIKKIAIFTLEHYSQEAVMFYLISKESFILKK